MKEGLFLFGPDIEIEVPNKSESTKWEAKKLSDAHPYYWKNIFPGDTKDSPLEPFCTPSK